MIRFGAGAALLLSLCIAIAAGAQQTPPPGGEPRPFSLPAKTRFSLDNGLAATLVEFGNVPKATILVAVSTGNVDEDGATWLADMTGELMREGTTRRSAADIAREAASMGGDIAINVGLDQTTLRADVLSEHAPRMLELLAEILTSPALPAAEIDRIRADFLRNLSVARTQPGALANEAFSAALFPDHAYGRVYPTAAQISGYTIDDVRAFYQDHFGAARTRVYVAGRFDASRVRASTTRAFGNWRTGPPPVVTNPEPRRGPLVRLVDRPGAPQSTIHLGLPVLTPGHADYLPLQLTNVLLGGAFSSRITANIREDKGYTYSPNSSLAMRRGAGFWRQVADVTTEHTAAAIREIVYEIRRLQNEPPSAAEVTATRNYRTGTFVLSSASRGGLLSQLAFIDLHGLDDAYLEHYAQNVQAVTAADLSRLARDYLPVDEMTLVVVGDLARIRPQLENLEIFGPLLPD